MTWDEILILLIMVMGLVAIDMLVAKFNLTAGRIVAVLTFFVMMPLGLVAGIIALVCLNQKRKKWKASIVAFLKNVVFHAFLLSIVLIYLVDVILLKIFPDATFPVVFFSFCFSPLFIFLLAKALDYFKDIKRKPKIIDITEDYEKDNQKQQSNAAENGSVPPGENAVPELKTILEQLEKDRKGEKKNNTAENHSPKPTRNAYSEPVINSVSDYLYHYDPDYQDYLQGNIRPERYKNIDLIPNIRPKYTDQTVKIVFSPGTTEIKEKEFENRKDLISVVIPEGVKVRKQAFAGCENLKHVKLHDNVVIARDAFLYCNKLSDEAEQKIADKVEGMYRKTFVKSDFPYVTPIDDPNYDTTGEGLDTNKFIYETRRAQNGEFYTVCFSCLY